MNLGLFLTIFMGNRKKRVILPAERIIRILKR